MPDIQITDQLDTPVPGIKVDLSQPSSLVKYLQTELLHLAVFPDFLLIKDTPIGRAAGAKPVSFDAKAQHKFQLGNTKPEIDVTPAAEATLHVNAVRGANLFDADPFRVPAKVPDDTGYVSVGFQGSLDLGVSGSDGDLTFGFDSSSAISLEHWKAFPLEATVGDAVARTLSSFVIPADVSDLALLGENDIAAVSGTGSLKISGGVSVAAAPNPLASAALPLGVGTVAVKAGATAGLSANFTLSGAYQVRARRKDAGTIELSFLKERTTALQTTLSVSAQIKATIGDADLVAALLGAISTDDPTRDQKLLSDLTPQELKTLSAAIRSGLNHSLEASLGAVLSAASDDQAAFQYEIQPARLTPEASLALHRALDGDLTLLTEMEEAMQDGGVLAPGLKLLSSIFYDTRKRGATLKLNLIGILNYLTVSELIRHSEVITDDATGDVTIQETVTGNEITALVKPLDRNEALRKAIFHSVLVTTSYRAGRAVALPELDCEQMHFAMNQNTNAQIMGDYLRWFVALNLLNGPERAGIVQDFVDGGGSSCVLRSRFSDSDCASMFLNENGTPRPKDHYLEIGRQAMRALLDPEHQDIDGLRYRIVDDNLWPQARAIGANANLGPLVGLSTGDARVVYLIGDVMDIIEWAGGMADAATRVADMRKFVGTADVAMLLQNNDFKKKRDALQAAMASMVKASKLRFDEPWGMVSLFWAAGSPNTAYGKISTPKIMLERGKPAAAALTAASS